MTELEGKEGVNHTGTTQEGSTGGVQMAEPNR